MKVYIQAKNGMPTDQDHFNAYAGFREMGFETVFFGTIEELSKSKLQDIVVGYVGTVKSRLNNFGLTIEDVDYPDCLNEFLGRKLWKATINEINTDSKLWPVFIKPVSNKKFKGRVVKSISDMIGCGSCYENYEIWCSEVKKFIAEFRVFVLYDEIIDVRRYGGEWNVCCEKVVVEACVKKYSGTFSAYALDFGITENGETLLIEVNNTCSIGSYGLDPVLYAKFISARWAELTDTIDECRF